MQLPLDLTNQLPDMLWRASVEGEIVPVIDEWLFILVHICASFLGVQLAQDLVDGPPWEFWAENRGPILRISCGSVSLVASL